MNFSLMHKYKSAHESQKGQSEIIALVSTKVISKYVLAKIYHKKAPTERNDSYFVKKMPQIFRIPYLLDWSVENIDCLKPRHQN